MFKPLFLTLLQISHSFIINTNVISKPALNHYMSSNLNMKTPQDIVQLINNRELQTGNSWSYNDLVNHLNTVKSAVIVDNQNVGLFYDDSDLSIHTFKYLPDTISDILTLITKKGIDYQVMSIPLPEEIQVEVREFMMTT